MSRADSVGKLGWKLTRFSGNFKIEARDYLQGTRT
jgi:hypothetical protein